MASLIWFIIILSVIVISHEFGHFIVARINGIRVLEFDVGFGPTLLHFTKKGTKFALKLLPFGGACVFDSDVTLEPPKDGDFNKTEDDCYMYKVQDVKLERSLLQRMAGLGTVVCFTGDTTNPQLLIQNIKNSKEVKDYILKQSEVARIKRRTINMVDIGAGIAGDLDGDGFIDQMN